MSEVKDISSIEGGAFPSLEVLQRYLRGEASAEEKAQIKAMLEDDPMMADAIEGLQMIKDPALLQRSIQKITSHSRQQLKRQINKREALIRRQSRIAPKNLLPYIGTAAAAIALLITTVFVIRQMDSSVDGSMATAQEQVAKTESSEPQQTDLSANAAPIGSAEENDTAPSSTLSAPIAQATPPLVRRDQNNRENAPSALEDPRSVPITIEATEEDADQIEPFTEPSPTLSSSPTVPQVSETTGAAEQAIEREEEIALDELADDFSTSPSKEYLIQDSTPAVEYFDAEKLENIPEYEDEVRTGNSTSTPKPRRKGKVVKQTTTTEPLYETAPRRSVEDIQQGQLERAAAITDMIAKAAKHLEAKEYDKAILQLDEVLLTEPQNVVAHHYRAQAYLAKGNDEAAQSSLETVVMMGSENFEGDQWALANVYRRLGKKLKARNLLKEIVKTGGTYAQQAQALLDQ
ncbi:MAG: tetratricopeptide repeat protein [Bacteroidota bacterium]